MRYRLAFVLVAYCTAAGVAPTCEFGDEYNHADRVYHQFPDDRIEVVSVMTQWFLTKSHGKNWLHVSMLVNRVILSSGELDVRTTDDVYRSGVEMLIDPETCEITFSPLWYDYWTRRRYVFTGNVTAAVKSTEFGFLEIAGESRDWANGKNENHQFVLDIYRGLRPDGLKEFTAKIIGNTIQIGGESEIVLTEGKMGVLQTFRDEYRKGVGIGEIDVREVARFLEEKKAALTPTVDAVVEDAVKSVAVEPDVGLAGNGLVDTVTVEAIPPEEAVVVGEIDKVQAEAANGVKNVTFKETENGVDITLITPQVEDVPPLIEISDEKPGLTTTGRMKTVLQANADTEQTNNLTTATVELTSTSGIVASGEVSPTPTTGITSEIEEVTTTQRPESSTTDGSSEGEKAADLSVGGAKSSCTQRWSVVVTIVVCVICFV